MTAICPSASTPPSSSVSSFNTRRRLRVLALAAAAGLGLAGMAARAGTVVLSGSTLQLTPVANGTAGQFNSRYSSLGFSSVNLWTNDYDTAVTQDNSPATQSGQSGAATSTGLSFNAAFNGTQAFYNDPGAPTTNFIARFTGAVQIATAGAYTFQTLSDDGTRLYIDNKLVVLNDGSHASVTVTSPSVTLSAGLHEFRVDYTQGTGGNGMVVNYSGADTGGTQKVLGSVGTNGSIQTLDTVPLGDDISLQQSSTINLNGTAFTQVGENSLTFAQTAASPATLTVTAADNSKSLHFGSTTLLGGVTNTINNGPDVFAGRLTVSNPSAVTTLAKSGTGQLFLDNTTLPSNLTANATIDVQAGRLVLVGSGTSANNPVGGANLQLSGGTLVLDSKVGPATFDNALTVASASTIEVQPSATTLTLGSDNNGVALNANLNVAMYGSTTVAAGNLLINGPIVGSARISKVNPVNAVTGGNGGILIFGTSNPDFNGTVALGSAASGFNAGNIQGNVDFASDKPFGTGPLVIHGGTVYLRAGGSVGTAYNIASNITADASFILDGNQQAGTISTNGTFVFGSATFSTGATLTVNSGNAFNFQLNGPLTLGGNSTLNVNAGILQLQGGLVGGTSTVTKGGGGTLALVVPSTGSGSWTINNGTVNANATNAVTGNTTVTGSAARLNLNAANAISSGKTLAITSSAVVNVNNATGMNNVSVTTLSNGGLLHLAAAGVTIGALPTITNGAELQFDAGAGNTAASTATSVSLGGVLTAGVGTPPTVASIHARTGIGDLSNARVTATAFTSTSVPNALRAVALNASGLGVGSFTVAGVNSVLNQNLGTTGVRANDVATTLPNANVAANNGAINFPSADPGSDATFNAFFGKTLNDAFTAYFAGTYTAAASGTHSFGFTDNDDNVVVIADTNGNGQFDAGDQLASSNCCGNTGSISTSLRAGQKMLVGYFIEDTSGKSGLVGTFQEPNAPGARNTAPTIVAPGAATQSGLWSYVSASSGGGNLNVDAGATLKVGSFGTITNINLNGAAGSPATLVLSPHATSVASDAVSLNVNGTNATATVDTGTNNAVTVQALSLPVGNTLSVVGAGSVTVATPVVGGASVGTLAVGGSANVTLPVGSSIAALNLSSAGKATVAASASPAAAGTLTVTSLSAAGTAKLDLTNNGLVIPGGSLATVGGLVATGYAAGAWTGPGIVSANAVANPGKGAVGYGSAGIVLGISGATTGTFLGQTVSPADVLARYTSYGDANLDGIVNFADFVVLSNHFGTTVANGWDLGDFNFDNKVDFADFVLLSNNFGTVAPVPSPAVASFEANAAALNTVPEPASASVLLAAAATGLLARRRTR